MPAEESKILGCWVSQQFGVFAILLDHPPEPPLLFSAILRPEFLERQFERE